MYPIMYGANSSLPQISPSDDHPRSSELKTGMMRRAGLAVAYAISIWIYLHAQWPLDRSGLDISHVHAPEAIYGLLSHTGLAHQRPSAEG